MPTPEGRRWIGRMLRDRWKIDARISRGGVGTVYAATHKNNGSRAAIKVLHPEFARDTDARSRFLQEGYAANQVNHPGVVRILDDDTSEDGHAYLVMELLEGELLETRRVRKGGKLPLSDVYEVGAQLLDVLAAAHDKGIVHRDIKPENLFVTQEGRLKVLDFGFAQMRSQFRTEVTKTGYLLGTPGFMSPEQSVGNRAEVDALSDIWAAGATLFTLISGEPVHDGDSVAEILVAVANYPPRSLATVASGLPPRLVDVVDRAVAFDKADRWPNARAMQLALRGAAGLHEVGTVSRRSIPDVEPISEGPTLHGDPMFEELDPSDLVESTSARWASEAAASPESDRPAPETRPSGTRAPWAPGDGEGEVRTAKTDPVELAPRAAPPQTVGPSDSAATRIRQTPARDGSVPNVGSPPAGPETFAPPLRSDRTLPLTSPSPQGVATENLGATAPDRMQRDERMHLAAQAPAPPAALPPPAAGPSQLLVFVGVVLMTMAAVIGAGLLVLALYE